MRLASGQRFGSCRVVREIARGGMAVVYEVERAGARFALKLPLSRDFEFGFGELFAHEARVSSALSHPNLVHVVEHGEHEGAPYLLMELVEGVNLAEFARRAHAHRDYAAHALFALAEAATGLAAAHGSLRADGTSLGLVHRDVTPENVLVGRDGAVKLADFGIADTVEHRRRTRTGELRGKLAHLAPEQITRERPTTFRSDLWALGVTAYEVLSAGLPFRGENEAQLLWAIVHAEPKPFPDGPGAVSVRVCDFIVRLLAKDPFARPRGAGECASLFREEALLLGATPETFVAFTTSWFGDAPSRAERAEPRGWRRATRVAAGGALIVAGLAAFAVPRNGEGPPRDAAAPQAPHTAGIQRPVTTPEVAMPLTTAHHGQHDTSVPTAEALEQHSEPAPTPMVVDRAKNPEKNTPPQAEAVGSPERPAKRALMENPYP